MNRLKNHLILIIVFWNMWCVGFSATYFYQLYLHNEYYAEPPGFPNKLSAAPIVSSFDGHGDTWKEKRLSVGLIEALRLCYDHTWVEFIAAFGKERVRYNRAGVIGTASRFGGDDFLIDVGHNFLDETGKKQLLLHWLTGIPLTDRVTLADVESPLWGTRTFATGPVIEIAYDFVRNEERDIFLGFIGRFLHRFRRNYVPILPPDAYFNPGNQMDLLALFHYRRWQHNIEIGYVYSLYNKISYQFPTYTEPIPSNRYNTFYVDYFYFNNELSLSFEINISKTFGTPYEGATAFGIIAWYF